MTKLYRVKLDPLAPELFPRPELRRIRRRQLAAIVTHINAIERRLTVVEKQQARRHRLKLAEKLVAKRYRNSPL